MTAVRPYVTLSYAQSADGRIASAGGRSERISGPESSEFAHTLRRDNAAILVGIGTVLKDDPLLTCRLPGECRNPLRVVLDSRLRLPPEAQLAAGAREVPTVVFTGGEAPDERERPLKEAGVRVERVETDADGRPDLAAVLGRLAGMGLESVFVEGGAGVITAFLRQRLVDRLFLVSAPIVIGRGTEAVGDLGTEAVEEALSGRTVSLRRAGQDVIWEIAFDRAGFVGSAGSSGAGEHSAGGETSVPQEPAPGHSGGGHDRAGEQRRTARCVYFTAPGKVELREEEIAGAPGAVEVESRVIGISHGTERRIWEGAFPRGESADELAGLSGEMDYPLKYGYMNAGETDAGERVFAFMPHQDRFFAAEEQMVRFPAEADFEDIVLYPSVETAYTVAVDAAVLPGERVLLIGQGMIGLLTAELLRTVRGVRIAALEPDEHRRRLGEALGLHCITPAGGVQEELRRFFGGGADKVINLSGSGEGLQQGLESAAFGGTVVEASWYGSRAVQLQLGGAFHRRRLTIRSSQVSTLPEGLRGRWDRGRRTEEVRRLTMELRPSRYVTHRYPLAEAQRAFEEIYSAGGGVVQGLLE